MPKAFSPVLSGNHVPPFDEKHRPQTDSGFRSVDRGQLRTTLREVVGQMEAANLREARRQPENGHV